MHINWELKKKISDMGFTQGSFAEKVGIWETIVSEVTRGKRNLSDRQEQVWAKALKCKVTDIFGGDDDKHSA